MRHKLYLILVLLLVSLAANSQDRRKTGPAKVGNTFLKQQWYLGLRWGVNLTKAVPENRFSTISPLNFDAAETEYRLIGPSTVSGLSTGDTSIIGDTFGGIPVLKIIIDDEIIGIWSRQDIDVTSLTGPEQTELTGFSPKIFRGLTLNKNLGPSSEQTLFGGPATEAFYADLAERYAVDGPVEAGDIVSIGGEAEVTKTTIDKDESIFGVVSTNPGLKLNAVAGNDETHPYIALIGRVPCKIIGAVNKGDRLVSSSIPGVARVVTPGEIMKVYPAIFGRALETNLDEEIKIIEVTIGVK